MATEIGASIEAGLESVTVLAKALWLKLITGVAGKAGVVVVRVVAIGFGAAFVVVGGCGVNIETGAAALEVVMIDFGGGRVTVIAGAAAGAASAGGGGGGSGGGVAATAAVTVTGAFAAGVSIASVLVAVGTGTGGGLATLGGKGAASGAFPKEIILLIGFCLEIAGVGAISLVSGAESPSFLSTAGGSNEFDTAFGRV